MVSKLQLTAALAKARYEAAFNFNVWINKQDPEVKAKWEECLIEINKIKAQIKHLFGDKE